MPDSHSTDQNAGRQSGGLLASGTVVDNKYKVLSVLGSGGMGTVYRVLQLFLKREYALKTLTNRTASDVALRRFQMEASAASALHHPNLVQVHDFGLLDNDEAPFLVMDLVDGTTLTDRLKARGPLTVEEAVPLFLQACAALNYAHEQGIVHRDIKPGNIMLVKGVPLSAEGSVKVVDFGIAKLTGVDGGEIQALTKTGEVFGSPLYMSPEQCTGDQVDQRSDIYSLGCVLFEALTGTPPHMGATALATMMLHQSTDSVSLKEASLGREFPLLLERVVAKMLSKSPANRFATMAEVGIELRKLTDLSRTKLANKVEQTPAGNGVDAAAGDRWSTLSSERTLKFKPGEFFLLAALLILLVATISGACGYLLGQSRTASVDHSESQPNITAKGGIGSDSFTPVEEAVQDKETKINKETMILKQAGPLRVIRRRVNDKMQKFVVFPKLKIGNLCIYSGDKFEVRPGSDAVNEVAAEDGPLSLIVQGHFARVIVNEPSLFESAPDEFHGLCLKLDRLKKDDTEMERKLPIKKESVAEILSNLQNWKNLETLSLEGVPLNATAVKNLEHLKSLHVLKIENCPFDQDASVPAVTINKITQLSLKDLQPGVLKQLVGELSTASQVEDLHFRGQDINASLLRGLRSCRQLKYLDLDLPTYSDDIVTAITRLPQLRRLCLAGSALDRDQVNLLRKCSWLTSINLFLSPDETLNLQAKQAFKKNGLFFLQPSKPRASS